MSKKKHKKSKWIPVTVAMPPLRGSNLAEPTDVLIAVRDEEGCIDTYMGFYDDNDWYSQWSHGCNKLKDEKLKVTVVAWRHLPKKYKPYKYLKKE